MFFFTVVTDRRRPILTSDLGRRALREAIAETRRSLPFEVSAIVHLPDHLHAIWELPRCDADYSTQWRLIKTHFTKTWRRHVGSLTPVAQVTRQPVCETQEVLLRRHLLGADFFQAGFDPAAGDACHGFGDRRRGFGFEPDVAEGASRNLCSDFGRQIDDGGDSGFGQNQF